MSEGEILLMWSYWPKLIQGTQDNSVKQCEVACSFRHAIVLANELKIKYGANLGDVYVKIKII